MIRVLRLLLGFRHFRFCFVVLLLELTRATDLLEELRPLFRVLHCDRFNLALSEKRT